MTVKQAEFMERYLNGGLQKWNRQKKERIEQNNLDTCNTAM